MLTNVEDTDVRILSDLTFADLQQVCSTHTYLSNLYKTNKILKKKRDKTLEKVNNIINLLPNILFLIIQPYHDILYPTFVDYMIKLDIVKDKEIELEEFANSPWDDSDTYYVSKINLELNKDLNYWIEYSVGDSNTSFKVTKSKLKEFLFHIFYDGLIITY